MEKTHFTADPPFLVGQRIRDERNKWNFTQEQLSEHLGISTNYLGQIERGRTFSRALAERICEFFHITYDYLYYGASADQARETVSYDMEDGLSRLIATCSLEERRLCTNILKEVLASFRSFRREKEEETLTSEEDS